MKERPILFNAPMVRALLDGSKTQTRRVVKPQPSFFGSMTNPNQPFKTLDAGLHCPIRCPYGQPGDRLWVRESFDIIEGQTPDYVIGVDYRASHPECSPTVTGTVERFQAGRDTWQWRMKDIHGMRKWKPSIHMPRTASRITLEITGVRVERLQDISEADARAEGARSMDVVSGRETLDPNARQGSYVAHYKHIWQEINGPGSWGANPWVWVIEFKRVAA